MAPSEFLGELVRRIRSPKFYLAIGEVPGEEKVLVLDALRNAITYCEYQLAPDIDLLNDRVVADAVLPNAFNARDFQRRFGIRLLSQLEEAIAVGRAKELGIGSYTLRRIQRNIDLYRQRQR